MNFNLSRIFESFSKRQGPQKEMSGQLTSQFRSRVLMLCRDTFQQPAFWQEMHKVLQYMHGRPVLNQKGHFAAPEDAISFLHGCSNEQFLDFIEKIFVVLDALPQRSDFWGPRVNESEVVSAINEFFRQDNLPFTLLDSVYEEVKGHSYGPNAIVRKLVSHPQVICRESEVLHDNAISTTLALLPAPYFSAASREFHEALQDYRNGDYGDCVVKCGSAFESVMKVICDRKGWEYRQEDTASKLLDTILPRTSLETFFSQPIMLVATIRNRLSSAHGAGNQPRTVSKQVAQYVINATASAILLLVEETQP